MQPFIYENFNRRERQKREDKLNKYEYLQIEIEPYFPDDRKQKDQLDKKRGVVIIQ